MNFPDQMKQIVAGIHTVGTQVYPREDDLPESMFRKAFHFPDHIFRISAPHPSSCKRNEMCIRDSFYSSPVTVSASVCVSVVSSVVSSVVPVTVSVSSVELCSGSAAISTIMSLAVMDVFNV